jgi:hypothetical protein
MMNLNPKSEIENPKLRGPETYKQKKAELFTSLPLSDL